MLLADQTGGAAGCKAPYVVPDMPAKAIHHDVPLLFDVSPAPGSRTGSWFVSAELGAVVTS